MPPAGSAAPAMPKTDPGHRALPQQRGLVHRFLGFIVRCGVLGLGIATVASLLARQWWVAELFTHFRPQYLAGGIVLLVASVLLSQRGVALALVCLLALNGWLAQSALRASYGASLGLAPVLASGANENGQTAGTLRLISANVLVANAAPAALIDLVQRVRPDVLLVVEHTPAFDDALLGIAGDYPYRLTEPTYDAFGIGLYSRLPIVDAEIVDLGATRAVRAGVDTGAGVVQVLGVHLLPPTQRGWAAERNAQLAQIDVLLGDGIDNALVCGDFNATPFSPLFAAFVAESPLRLAQAGHPFTRTWPAGSPLLGLKIDHCLVGAALQIGGAEVLGDIDSDHYPVLVEVTVGTDG